VSGIVVGEITFFAKHLRHFLKEKGAKTGKRGISGVKSAFGVLKNN